MFLALVVFCGVLSLVLPPFRDPYNLLVMGKQLSTLAIIAAGQTLVVISGRSTVPERHMRAGGDDRGNLCARQVFRQESRYSSHS